MKFRSRKDGTHYPVGGGKASYPVIKNWEKISNTKYINKKRKGVLYIFDDNTVNISIDTVKIDGVEFTKTMIHEEFKTKQEANSFAKKYMREQL